jgi:hypothetical protein
MAATDAEVRLRIVEALARNASATAINNTDHFISAVVKITTCVLGDEEVDNHAVPEPAKKPIGRPRKLTDGDKAFLV